MRSPIRELDYPNLLSGFSFLNEPENTAKMDRNKRLPVTPLMFFSLILSLSIITARYSYDYFSTRYWLIAAIIAIALAGCCYVLNENRQLFRLFFRTSFCRSACSVWAGSSPPIISIRRKRLAAS